MKTPEAYKELSIQEFTKAAQQYDSANAGVYEMCKQDYPPILEELRHEPFKTLLDAGCGTIDAGRIRKMQGNQFYRKSGQDTFSIKW